MRAKYFFGFMVSFIVGVAVESILNFGYSFAILCTMLSIFVFLIVRTSAYLKNVLLVSLILFGSALGIFRVDVSQMNTYAHTLDGFTEKVVTLEGIIIDEPDVRETYTNIVLYVHSVSNVLGSAEAESAGSRLGRHPGREIKSARVLMRVPTYPEFRYGDELSVVGKLIPPKNFESKGNVRAFDYRAYLAKDDIHYQMYFPKVSIVTHSKGSIVREKLSNIKSMLIKNISQKIPEPESSLASGITLGAKQSLGEELLQKFRETGVAHIVVLSGYNIAVVAGIISRLVILLIIILARALGRENDALRALALAGGIMVFVNPMILLNDVSFQLSFSATLAIVVFVPVIEKYFIFISNRVLREIVVTTFATQIFVMPLILYHMGTASLIGFISNIFILPVVPLAMLAVALVAVFAWAPLMGSVLAIFAHALLAYIVTAVKFFAKVPFASLSGISFPLWALVLAYLFLCLYIVKNLQHTAEEKTAK
ncbi:MAG: internalization-related competence protein ComEC/Rec2 protein [Candidatus Nomurabacteria bacterium GW2011_GWB1_43_20]|nr:MAG: internalization-related competence protein ComEC/Rec2 protein [Candidatus Nomurabacteria bacterium GW2011_GWB1_43_20]